MVSRGKDLCGICALHSLPALRGVSAESWADFRKLRATRLYSRGNILFYDGNPPAGMWFLCRGRVKIVKSDASHRLHISRVAQAPDLLGDRALIAGENYKGNGEVMEESRVCFLASAHFERLFLKNPAVCLALARRFAAELGEAEEKARDLALKTIRSRLAKHLLDALEEKLARKHPDLTINLDESRLELAEILGTSPEAVCRSLAEFRAKRMISTQGRSVRVLDEERLRQVANS